MASAVSALYLIKVSSYSYFTATLQIVCSDFLHTCNCKQDFQQTGGLSGQKNTEAKKALRQKVILCNLKTEGRLAKQYVRHRASPIAFALLRLPDEKQTLFDSIISTLVFKNRDKTVLDTTTTTIIPLWNLDCEWEQEEILNLKKYYASIFLILLVTAISLATYVSVN